MPMSSKKWLCAQRIVLRRTAYSDHLAVVQLVAAMRLLHADVGTSVIAL
jgi:hypothetical protein